MFRQNWGKLRLLLGFTIISLMVVFAAYSIFTQNSITVHDQVLGEYIILEEVKISHPYGAKIALTINGSMKGGQWVGTSPHLAPGTYTHIGIPLDMVTKYEDGTSKAIRPKHGDIVYVSVFSASENDEEKKVEHPLLFSTYGKPMIEKIKVF